MATVALVLIATGKYKSLLPVLLESSEKHFLPHHQVIPIVYSDQKINTRKNLQSIHLKHEPWPDITLKKFHIINQARDTLSQMDYIFYCDVDMRFMDTVGDEIIPEEGIVAVQHSGFYKGKRGTYETRPESLAYVAENEGKIYFHATFVGGTAKAFLNMAKTIEEKINRDLENNIIAVWHDESHLNRYLINNPPAIVLNPGYAYPEKCKEPLPFPEKIRALTKNHNKLRGSYIKGIIHTVKERLKKILLNR